MKKFVGAFFATVFAAVLLLLFPMSNAHAEPASEPGGTYEVSTWDELKEILESEEYDGATLLITKDIEWQIDRGTSPSLRQYLSYDSQGKATKKNYAIYVRGNKTIDLNGKTLTFDDCSNAQYVDYAHANSAFYSLGDHESTFLLVGDGAHLTISDSKDGGTIHADGYFIGTCSLGFGYYWDFYCGYCYRNAVEVTTGGKLTVTDGKLIGGGSKRQYINPPIGYAGGYRTVFGLYAYQVIRGYAVVVQPGAEFVSTGGIYDGNLRDTILVREDAKVRFYDGKVRAWNSGNCFYVSEGADVKVYGGSFETYYNDKIRHYDKIPGYSTYELTVDIIRSFANGGYGVIDPKFDHQVNGSGSHDVDYDYGHIGIPREAIDFENSIVSQNMKDEYDPDFKGNTRIIPKSEAAFELISNKSNVIGQTIDYYSDLGSNPTISICKRSLSTGGSKEESTEDDEWSDYGYPDEIIELAENSYRKFIWEFTTDMSTAAAMSYEGGSTIDLATVVSERQSFFAANPECYVRCRVETKWGSISDYTTEYTSDYRMLRVHERCDHNWKILYNTSTCSLPGERVSQCTFCKETKTEFVSANGVHTTDWTYVYFDAERHGTHCKYCGMEMDAAKHEKKEISRTTIDCETTVIKYSCTTCRTEFSEAVSLSSHAYGAYESDPLEHWSTCTKCGNSIRTAHDYVHNDTFKCTECRVCGYIYGYDFQSGDISSDSLIACPHESLSINISAIPEADQYIINTGQYVTMGWYFDDNSLAASDTLLYTPTYEDWNKAYQLRKNYSMYYLNFIVVTDEWGNGYSQAFEWVFPEDMTLIPETPATCVTEGTRAFYICPCGTSCDAGGNPITPGSLVIPQTGHRYDNDCDPICNICGAARATAHKPASEYQQDGENHWKVCWVCGEKLEVKAHVPETTVVSVSSCTTEGRKITKCSVCSRMIAEETEAKTAHLHTSKTVVEATCTEEGSETVTCTDCGQVIANVAVRPLGHAMFEVAEVPADCMTEGSLGYYGCIRCGKTFADIAGTTELTEFTIAKDTENHVGGELHHDEESHWFECECGAIIDKEAHTLREDDTCCTVCEYCKNPLDGGEDVTEEESSEAIETSEEATSEEATEPVTEETGRKFPWGLLIFLLLLICGGGAGAAYYAKKNGAATGENESK